MDCLSVLRDYAMRGKLEQVSITDTDVLFGDGQRFPRDTKTAYKSNQGKGEYYQLDILVYYMQNVDTPNYIANARAANMRTVMFLDRKVGMDGMCTRCLKPQTPPRTLLHTCSAKQTPAITSSSQTVPC